ncbi:MAG: hypothetical protein COW41_08700 [Deltaproteobacteria bacterium CG17_big_fil_post_rev_8_21_14_2_50_51_6]|nr:MAG: hypothetical protein COW41_08700 [Deltaproteobacteria bacterium CG17_big_fil_post_rev_8_21_14_2_50_51_6]
MLKREANISDPFHKTGAVGRVIAFALFLKDRGFQVYQNSIIDSLRSLLLIDPGNRDEFKWALRANFVSCDLEWQQFDNLFSGFWLDNTLAGRASTQTQDSESALSRKPDGDLASQPVQGIALSSSQGGNLSPPRAPDDDLEALPYEEQASSQPKDDSVFSRHPRNPDIETQYLEGVAYSPLAALEKKDFKSLDSSELQAAQLALRSLLQPFRIDKARRKKRSKKKGKLDFARIIRASLKRDGYPFDLFFKERKRRLKRLVILADVSGSMDRYARFVMPFLLGLRSVGPRAEVFVFSTTLTSITHYIRHLSLDKALERISRKVPDWSGGTRIGYSLMQFNKGYGAKMISRRNVVVLLSDGWDLGGRELLVRQMAALKKRVYRIVWLNPIESDPDLQSVCRAMRSALPHIDHVLSADSLQSLRRVSRLLSRLMVH